MFRSAAAAAAAAGYGLWEVVSIHSMEAMEEKSFEEER